MLPLLVMCSGLFVNLPVQEKPPSTDLANYQAIKLKVGHDSDAHVRLALWCEAHGLGAERLKHLALAVLTTPSHTTARGLMGLVSYQGRWQPPDAVTDRVRKDVGLAASLAEYNARRAKLVNTADGHWRLAVWCEEHGLKAEAMAHFTTVLRLDPGREAAWKRLGCKKHNGRWMTAAQIAEEKVELEARKQADKHWRPLLAKLSTSLAHKEKRAETEEVLSRIVDPRAVGPIWRTFAEGNVTQQTIAVQLFGQINTPAASRALAAMAVFSDAPEIRRKATETLKRRDPREFVGLLISMIRDPIKYEVRPVGGPGSPGALFVRGKQFNVQRLYAPPSLPNIPLFPGEPITYDAWGLPVVSRYLGETNDVQQRTLSIESIDLGPYTRYSRWRKTTTTTETTTTPIQRTLEIPIGQIYLQYQTSALVAEQQLLNDAREIDSYNQFANDSYRRISQVLGEVTGQDLGQDQKKWMTWWVEHQGYTYTPYEPEDKPTFTENVPLAYVPQGVAAPIQAQVGTPVTTTSTSTGIGHSCFRAGTLVRTLEGLRPIERLKIGDQLLTQNTLNGTLAFQPVLAVYHNKPSTTLKIVAGGDTVVATPIHRFWKAGTGWTMARDLKPGDSLRILGGTAEVVSIENDVTQPVFNLEVASGQSFFVGDSGMLVHDNSLVQPVSSPFDAEPRLEAITHGK